MAEFLVWLQAQHDNIMGVEKEAHALMAADNITGYKKKMQKKAELLANLASEADPQLTSLAPAEAKIAQATLASFSANAKTALKLDSIFYMANLLYKDEHHPGEPDNLQALIDELKKQEKKG